MRYRVAFRPQARSDILSIYDFVSQSSGESVAGSVIARIETACHGLSDFPFRGSRRDDLGSGIRTIAVLQRATVAYRVENNIVRIGRVLYAGRNYSADDMREV